MTQRGKRTTYRTKIYNEQKYAEGYALGKEILAAEPENLKVLVDLGANGYLVLPLKNPALTAEALDYATRALQMIESGKTVRRLAAARQQGSGRGLFELHHRHDQPGKRSISCTQEPAQGSAV